MVTCRTGAIAEMWGKERESRGVAPPHPRFFSTPCVVAGCADSIKVESSRRARRHRGGPWEGNGRTSVHRVVVTGLGAITPVGLSYEESWRNLRAGVSGVDHIQSFDVSHLEVQIAAEVKGFDPKEFMDF